ncbi:histidine kinase [Paenibacillus sp. BIHB 4019]|uniref:Histidine kinase n=1 Tax=Paenibacillus sp. BIHB 4019 TaxID=1870819 RepID=A0A1B2DD30_9BACL|nr:sensor histidine kinase [Paenibacillus sp. BIHB 4019]ANY65616.1 histidine kinase [Paenibacillus sp. BIHB 4019]
MYFLNNIRLRNKMFLVYFLGVIAPIILTNAIFYNIITENVKEQRINDIDRAVEQIKNEFQLMVDQGVGLSSFFYADYKTNEVLNMNFTHTEDYVEAYDLYLRSILNNYSPFSSSLQNKTIYVDNPTLLNSGNIGILSDEVREEAWYKLWLKDASSQPVFVRIEDPEGQFQSFSLLRRMDYFADRMAKEKLIKIDFKTIDIMEIFSNLNVKGDMYLLGPGDRIEYTTNRAINWQDNAEHLYSSLKSDNLIQFEKGYGSISYLRGWKVVGTINEHEIIKEELKSRYFIVWSGCVMMIVPTVIILIITRSINVRIIEILKHMKKVKTQNFQMINYGEARDEIGQLTLEFNNMIMQIKTLINDVYITAIQKKSLELERRKAQLNALQSQINPHFLFNALETIRMRSLLKHEKETAKMIQSMAMILRSSLTWNKEWVTVEEELGFIMCFLDIQKYRFEDKLKYHVEVEPEARACVIPKMVFLPFVENASIHGIEPLKKGGGIDIRIGMEEDFVVFSVKDNGIGMNEEQVSKLYDYLKGEELIGDRIGIQNVIYRGKMLYGDRIVFEVHSRPGEGTRIVLKIPSNP